MNKPLIGTFDENSGVVPSSISYENYLSENGPNIKCTFI